MAESSSSTSSALHSIDTTEQLIQLYHEHPCLWKVADKDYKNRYIRDNAVRDIASELKIPITDVKEKIYNLRTQYNHYRRQLTKRKSGSGVEDTSSIKWKWFSSLEFLSDGTKQRATISNLEAVCL